MALLGSHLAKKFEVRICVTGQHKEMLEQVFKIFALKSDFNLSLMKHNQSLSDIAGQVLMGVSNILTADSYEWILVQGDTISALSGALAGFYNKVKVGHVEAGLRTYDLNAPFPEEANRQLISKLSTLHFAPTTTSFQNLLSEGVGADSICITGNTGIDSLHWVLENSELPHINLSFDPRRVPFILVTGHRRENFGDGFIGICKALQTIASIRPSLQIVYPVHMNPNVMSPVYELLSTIKNIHLIPPLDYLIFTHLMKLSKFVLTDSGGIQEEAPCLGKPVLVMRDVTDRPEGVSAGSVRLVGTDPDAIIFEALKLLDDQNHYMSMSEVRNLYGDGKASERISTAILTYK